MVDYLLNVANESLSNASNPRVCVTGDPPIGVHVTDCTNALTFVVPTGSVDEEKVAVNQHTLTLRQQILLVHFLKEYQ